MKDDTEEKVTLETAKIVPIAESIVRSLVGLTRGERAASMAMALFCLEANDSEFIDLVCDIIPQLASQIGWSA